MLEATEMDFWRRAAGRSRLERVTNEQVGEFVQVTHTIIGEVNRQFNWDGHVQRMPETNYKLETREKEKT